MAIKPIIDIQINDGPFKKFQQDFKKLEADFKKYADRLDKLPEIFAAINLLMAGQNAETEKQLSTVRKIAAEEDKANKKNQQKLSLWQKIGKSSESFAKNIKNATESLLKWGTLAEIFGGLAGLGGIYGLDRFANSVQAQRQTALGLGINQGKVNAFTTNYGRFLPDPQGLLESVAAARTDQHKQIIFQALGISAHDVQTKDAADLAVEVLERSRKRYQDLGGDNASTEMLRANQLLELLDIGALRANAHVSQSEQDKARAGYQEDVGRFNVPKDVSDAWVDLNRQLIETSQIIKKDLAKDLAALVPVLITISKWVGKIADAVLPWENRLQGTKIAVPDPLDKLLGPAKAGNSGDKKIVIDPFGSLSSSSDIDKTPTQPRADILKKIDAASKAAGVDALMVSSIAKIESNYNNAPKDNINPNGTIDSGLMQINSAYTKYSPSQLTNPDLNLSEGIARLKEDIKRETKNGITDIWAAFRDYNGSGDKAKLYADNMLVMYNLLRKSSGLQEVGHNVRITIDNKTGNSVIVSASQVSNQ